MISLKSKIYVAGHKGMVGSSLVKLLKKKGYRNIITRTKKQLDLTNQSKVFSFLKKYNPDLVVIAAAKVGGIYANDTFKADFLYQNLSIQNNLIHGSFLAGVKKLIFLGSSCIYPKFAKQPIKEEYLLTSKLESTNEAYAIAKIAGLKLCETYNYQYGTNYLCLMPCNLYGPGDNYHEKNSHFFPALIKKIHRAKQENLNEITLWGNGKALREIMHVDDLSKAIIHFMKKNINHNFVNIGSGVEMSIKKYALFIIKELNIKLKIKFDKDKPNGTPRKLLDSSLAQSYGWQPKISLKQGFENTYENFLNKHL